MTTPAYADDLRALLETHAKPVEFLPKQRWRNPEVPEVSTYNEWFDYEATLHASPTTVMHGGGCGWVIEPGAEVTEDTYTEWGGTFGQDNHVLGINVTPARCRCGRYTDMTLRYEKSLSQTLRLLLGVNPPLLTL
jgi:hypothetical protein